MVNWADIFTGALVAEVPMLFNGDGIPDLDAIARFSELLVRKPIDGVAVRIDARKRGNRNCEFIPQILEIWRKALPEPLTLTVGIDLSPGIDSNIVSSVLEYADFILAGIAVSSRKKPDETTIQKLYEDLAAHEIPVIIDFREKFSGKLPFDPDLLLKFFSIERVAGIRLALDENQILMQDLVTHIRMRFPEKAILTGCERFYGYSLYRGCHGAISRLGPVMTEIQRDMIDAWFMCETTAFLQLSRMVDNLAESIFHQPLDAVNARILAALVHIGMISEQNAVDLEYPRLDGPEREFVTATIDAIGEYTDAGS